MSRETICEVVDGIGKMFAHIPYAVCGHAAMIYYGNTLHTPDHISIVCPAPSLDALVGWAQARGLALCARYPHAFAYTTGDGAGRCVRALAHAGFDGLRRVRLGPGRASVLTLPVLADSMACDYVTALRDDDHAGMAQRARDICWLMHRIVEVGGAEQRLTAEHAGFLGRLEFLEPFSLAHERAVPLMERAGLHLASIPGFTPPSRIMPATRDPRRAGAVTVRATAPRLATRADGAVAGATTAGQRRAAQEQGRGHREAAMVRGARGPQARQRRATAGLFRLAQFVRAAVRFRRMGDVFRTKQARSACPPLVINRTRTTAERNSYTHDTHVPALKGPPSKIPRYWGGGGTPPRASHGSSTAYTRQSGYSSGGGTPPRASHGSSAPSTPQSGYPSGRGTPPRASRGSSMTSTRQSADIGPSGKRQAGSWDDEMDLVLGEHIVLCR